MKKLLIVIAIVDAVSQKTGGWGLYLRTEDKKGNDLVLTKDGKIVKLDTPSLQVGANGQ